MIVHDKRLLIVCTVPTEKSGIPGVIFNLLEGMDLDGFDVGYVSINEPDDEFKHRLEALGVRLYVIPRKLSDPFSYVRSLLRVANGYDVMHVHGNSATMVLEMMAAKLANVPLRIAHGHSTSCSMRIIDSMARPIFYNLCNGRLACGIEAGKFLYGKRDFKVVNNAVKTQKYRFDPDKRKRIRTDLNISEDEVVIGHVGNFVPAKNHDFLIDIFACYLKLNSKSRLLMLGAGDLMGVAKEKVERLGISDKCIFAGSVSSPQDYMQAMDMVVMPSTFEGLPLTLVEEQANGLPILVSDAITKDADMTRLVSFMSLNEISLKWAERIDQILKNALPRSEETSEKAIEDIKTNGFDIKTVASDLKKYYETRLDQAQKTSAR